MRLCAPCDGNLVKHIRQTRSTSGRVAVSPGKALAAGSRGALGCGFFGSGRKLRRPVGFRPGANRRGRPSRAARVITAATERPRRSAICGGASPASQRLRNSSSCSAQLATPATAKAGAGCVTGTPTSAAAAAAGLCSLVLLKPLHPVAWHTRFWPHAAAPCTIIPALLEFYRLLCSLYHR